MKLQFFPAVIKVLFFFKKSRVPRPRNWGLFGFYCTVMEVYKSMDWRLILSMIANSPNVSQGSTKVSVAVKQARK